MKIFAQLVVLGTMGSLGLCAEAAPLISASGLDGAGLGQLPVTQGRAFGELGYHSQDQLSITTVDLGAGYLLNENLELGVLIPYTHMVDYDEPEGELGNLALHGAMVELSESLRFSLALRVALPTAKGQRTLDVTSVQAYGMMLSNGQHLSLRLPGALSISTPVHLEAGRSFVGHLDAEFSVTEATSSPNRIKGTSVFGMVAPGCGGWLSPGVAIGARLPTMLVLVHDAGPDATFSIEPYSRFALGRHGFFGARFNLQLRAELDRDLFWGLMIGGGGVF